MHVNCRRGSTLLLDAQALLAKALLVKHVVSLVNNEKPQLRDVQLASADDVHDSARGSDNDVGANGSVTLQGARESGSDFETFAELSDAADDSLDLTGKLATRCENQGLRLLGLGVIDSRQGGDDERSGLAGSGLRLCNHVTGRVREHERESLLLNLGRLLVVQGKQTTVNRLGTLQQSVSIWVLNCSRRITYSPMSAKVLAE